MSKELTTKTFAILYWNDDYDWITEAEAERVKAAKRRGDKCIELGKEMSDVATIARVIEGPKMEAIIRRKAGERQCTECGRWIAKGFVCGCQGGKY